MSMSERVGFIVKTDTGSQGVTALDVQERLAEAFGYSTERVEVEQLPSPTSSEGKRWTLRQHGPLWDVQGPSLQQVSEAKKRGSREIEVVPASKVERLREALREITRHGRGSAALREIARAALADDESGKPSASPPPGLGLPETLGGLGILNK